MKSVLHRAPSYGRSLLLGFGALLLPLAVSAQFSAPMWIVTGNSAVGTQYGRYHQGNIAFNLSDLTNIRIYYTVTGDWTGPGSGGSFFQHRLDNTAFLLSNANALNGQISDPISVPAGQTYSLRLFYSDVPEGAVLNPFGSVATWDSNTQWKWLFDYLQKSIDQTRLNSNTRGGQVQLAAGVESSERPLFHFSGARDWAFSITYNSAYARATPAPGQQLRLGRGWTHNFEARVVSTPTTGPFVFWNDTQYGIFTVDPVNANTWLGGSDNARYMVLKLQGDGTWLLTRKDQSALLFSNTGVLLEDRDPSGRKLVLARDGSGRVSTITEPVSGTSLAFAYNANGAIATLTDNSGATVQLAYSGANGDLTQITNQRAKTTTFTYGANSQFATLADHLGAVLTENTTDSLGRVSAQNDGVTGNSVAVFAYSASGGNSVTTYTDRLGKQSVHTFDANYNLLSALDELNLTTTYTYDTAHRVTSVTDPLNRATTYTYDAQGNLLTATDPAGKVTTFTYDARNNLLTTTTPDPDPTATGPGKDPSVTTRTYDASNNLLTLTDALGRTTTWTYDANSLPLTMTLPGGGVTTYAYTAGRLTQVTDPQGVITKFGYDALGRLLYREDALGKRVTFTYDALGNVLTVVNATGQTTTYTYDHRNRVATVTDPAGAVTTNTYDHNNNLLTATVTATGLPTLVTTYTYDGEDRLKTVTTPDPDTTATGAGKDPLVTTYNYDDAGRLASVVAPAGTTTYAYDAASQLVTITDPDGKATTSEYNTRGHLTKVTDPLTRATNLTYDDAGRRQTATDPLSRLTTLEYDALHRVTKVTDPGNLVAQQGFDLNGNRTTLTNPANAATAFAYDSANRLTSETTPMGRATTYAYNTRGHLATATEHSTQQTTFTYDDSQRLSSTTDPVGTITLGRDTAGRVTTVTEGTKTLTRAYNAYGWLTSFTDGDGNTIGYTYDNLGRLTKLTYPGTPTKEVLYAYDAAGRLHTVTDWAGRITTYSYDAVSRLSQTLRHNGTKQVRTYDAASQLTALTELAPDGTTVIYSGTHTYDLAGQLTSETLSPSIAPLAVSATQTFDADNRLLTHNGSAVTFDADGNLLTIASGVAPATYAYDVRNRLTSAGGLSYGYDSENRRVSVTDVGGTTSYAIDPNAIPDQVLVKTAPGGAKTFYVYGLGLLHEETGTAVRFYHHDRRGDTIALTDNSGAVTDRVAYGVYGEIISRTGTTATPFLFNGRWGVQTDANGLYHHRARYYHPALRRFLNQDTVLGSITDSASLNRFAYANGNPVSLIDPFGLMAMDGDNVLNVIAKNRGLPIGQMHIGSLAEARAILAALGLDPNAPWPKQRAVYAIRALDNPEEVRRHALLGGVGSLQASLVLGASTPAFRTGPGFQASPLPALENSAGRVFWSGRQGANQAAAEAYAQATGQTTLGMTATGRALEAQGAGLDAWRAASAAFAKGASGDVTAFAGNAASNSIWRTIELPLLKQNPEVIRIIIKDAVNTSKTTIIYPRP